MIKTVNKNATLHFLTAYKIFEDGFNIPTHVTSPKNLYQISEALNAFGNCSYPFPSAGEQQNTVMMKASFPISRFLYFSMFMGSPWLYSILLAFMKSLAL